MRCEVRRGGNGSGEEGERGESTENLHNRLNIYIIPASDSFTRTEVSRESRRGEAGSCESRSRIE